MTLDQLPKLVTLYALRPPRLTPHPEIASVSWAAEHGLSDDFGHVWYLSPGAALHVAREENASCACSPHPSSMTMMRTQVPASALDAYKEDNTLAVRLKRGVAISTRPWHPAAPTRRAAQALLATVEQTAGPGAAFSKHSVLHGPDHWERVAHWGLVIGMYTPGCSIPLVYAFAFLHDLFRVTDDDDPQHGHRAAGWLLSDHGRVALTQFLASHSTMREYDDYGLHQWAMTLATALRDHSEGHIVALTGPEDPSPLLATIAVCWDADRYDYSRDHTPVDRSLFSTPYARENLWKL